MSESLHIPVKLDLSGIRGSLDSLQASVSGTPLVDVSGITKDINRVAQQTKAVVESVETGLASVKVGFDGSSMEAIEGSLEGVKGAIGDVSGKAIEARVSATGLANTLTGTSIALKPLSLINGNLSILSKTAGLAASGASQVAGGLGLISTVATYATSGLSVLMAPLAGLVIVPKLLAASFSLMFTVILAPFKLVIGLSAMFAKGVWAMLAPVLAVSKFVLKLKVGFSTFSLQLAMLLKILSYLPPEMRAVVGGLIALGAAGKLGRIAMAGLAIGIRVTNSAMRAGMIVLKVFTLRWISAMKMTAISVAKLTAAVTIATVAIARFAARKAIAGMNRLRGAVSNVAGAIGGRLVSMAKQGALALGVMAIAGAGWGITLAAEAEQAQVGFTTMLKSAGQAKAVLADLEQFAASTPFQLDSLRDGAKQLLNAGVATDGLRGRLTMLGDIAAGTGKPINDFVRIFAKVKSTGKVTLETLNQLAERGVPIYDSLAKQMGVNRAEMLKMISTGKVGFGDLDGALNSVATGAGVFAGGMAAQSQTLSGLFSTLKDNLSFAMRELGTEISLAVDFKGLMARGITFFQGLKTGIASARPAFVATWAVIKSGVMAVWEVATVVFSKITETLGVTSGNWLESFVTWAAVAAFAFKSWPDLAELAFVKLGLWIVQAAANFTHLFTGVLPALLTWFGENWRSAFHTYFDYVTTVFINIGTNIRNAMTAIWDFITSGGTSSLEMAWTPLLDGFRNTISELPNIPDRAISELEKNLQAQSENLGSALSTGLAEEIASNLKMLDDFKNTKVEVPKLDGTTADKISTVDDDGANTAGGAERKSNAVQSLNRGSTAALEAIFAGGKEDKTAKESLKVQKGMLAAIKKQKPQLNIQIAGAVG